MTEPMPHYRRVLVVGDLHGNLQAARRAFLVAKREGADAIFQVGDFGYWPHVDGGAFMLACSEYAEMVDIPLYWIDGNHENHDLLSELVRQNGYSEPIEVADRVHYVPRGCVLEWGGRRILGLGGAYSIDKEWLLREDRRRRDLITQSGAYILGNITPMQQRILETERWSWWPGEEITDEQVGRILRETPVVDVVFTHDRPHAASPRWDRKNLPECEPNQRRIQDVLAAVLPRVVIHGHLHYRYAQQMRVGPAHHAMVHGLDAEGRNNHDSDQGTDIPKADTTSAMKNAMVILDLNHLTVVDVQG